MHFSFFRRFLSDRSGNFAILAGLLAVPLVGSVALSVDYTNANRQRSQLQQSLDSAVLEIATKADGDATTAELDAFGTNFFETNLAKIGLGGTELVYLGSSQDPDGSITVSAKGTKPFTGDLTTLLDKTITTDASAIRKLGAPACTLALSKTLPKALSFSGSTNVSLTGCMLASNSKAADSVDRSGSANLAAACVQTPGGTLGINDDARTALACGRARERSFATADPLANFVPHSDVGCSNLHIPGGKALKEISPGTYCNNSININGGEKIKFASGAYVFKGTSIDILGGAEVTGTGVTIFLYSGANLSVAANALFDLSAPTSGPYAGVAIYSAPDNPVALKFNGGASQTVQGFVYNPKGSIEFSGNASTESAKCIRLVADTITMTGNSNQKADCAAELGGKEIRTVEHVSLTK